jgi:hypothetical protein
MKLADALLLQTLRDPQRVSRLSPAEWDLLIRQARAAGLLGRLAAQIEQHGLAAQVPAAVRRHLTAVLSIADKQRSAVLWEVEHLSRALRKVDARILLLKGAAYAAAGLAPAAGRTFSDIDIMAPKAMLPEVEKHLMLTGWVSAKLDDYDQRYYRQWMHELPPMVHLFRATNLDLHHNILPETARIRTRPDLILAAAQALPGTSNIFIPCPYDQVLHSATHLYHEGEWEHGLRDLSDLDCLLRAYAGLPNFWEGLLARAEELNLAGPLGHALSHTCTLLDTPVPDSVKLAMVRHTSPLRRRMMDSIFVNGLASAHISLRQPLTGFAEFLLFVRSHWLRMPMHLLIPHLLHKAFTRNENEKTEPTKEEK